MQKKLTISIDEAVYEGLHRVIGRRNISRFLEGLARPHILPAAIDEAYRQMAADEGARRKPRNGRKGWWET